MRQEKNNTKEKSISIIILVLIILQFLLLFFIIVDILAGIGHERPEGLVVLFNEEDVSTSPKVCLDVSDSSVQTSHNRIYIQVCDETSSDFRLKDSSSDFYIGHVFSKLSYENNIITANLSGETFYADESNNYTLTIPIEFEDGSETTLRVKLHIEYIEPPNYLLWGLLIFSPTILLILILIIWRVRKKK